jgi:predicted permease
MSIFEPGQADRDLDRELRGYIELLTEEKIKAGLSPTDARRAALLEVGGIEPVKEAVRDVRRGAALDTLLRDLRYALRTLTRTPGFTLVAVLTLAVGIGASTTIFTVVNGVLLRQFDVADAARVVVVSESNGDRGLRRPSASGISIQAWTAEARSLQSLSAYLPHNVDITGNGEPEEVVANDVSREFFRLTGAQPVIGRLLLPDEFRAGSPDVALIDEGYWRLSMGANPKILGVTLTIDGKPRTVVGVVQTAWPRGTALYLPMGDTVLRPGNWSQRVLVAGRLAPGVSREAALAELTTIALAAHSTDPSPTADWAVDVDSLLDSVVGSVRRSLYILLGAMGFVFLIVCANIASLLFARASARAPELAIRNALGASRGRVMRQLVVEGLLVTLAGSALGMIAAFWGVAILRRSGPATLPRLAEISVDTRVLWFGAALSIVTGVLVSLLPASRASGWQVHEALKAGGRSTTHGRAGRAALVVAEIAFATMLLVGAGLMTSSLVNQMNIPLGFDPARVLALDIDIPAARYDRTRVTGFVDQAEERLGALPGVEAVGTARAIPFESFGPTTSFRIDGRPAPDSRDAVAGAFYTPSTPGYLQAMKVGLVRGRYLQPADDRAGASRVVVVNQAMARRFWGADDPVGTRLILPDGVRAEVVGLVHDVRQRQLTADVSPAMWVPWSQAPNPSMLIVLRTTVPDPASILAAARREIWAVDPLLPVEGRVASEMYREALGAARFNAWLFGGFAAIALVLAALGVFALVSYATALRTREIGLRMALGAREGQVQRMIVADGGRLALLGLTLGVVGAIALSRVMDAIVYQVPTRGIIPIAAAVLILGAASLLASWLPARRASRVHPTEALRWAE